MLAIAASPGATRRLPGSPLPLVPGLSHPGVATLAGVRIGRDYRLALWASRAQPITLTAVGFDATTGTTAWTVQPGAFGFAPQPIEVFEAAPAARTAGAAGGRIRIEAPDLFGGESREGGIVGDIDVLMGGPDQGLNDYLAARQRGPVPALRGLCSLVLRQVYLGINPYLKPWAVRVSRLQTGESGAPQWYPEKAPIVPRARISGG